MYDLSQLRVDIETQNMFFFYFSFQGFKHHIKLIIYKFINSYLLNLGSYENF